MGYEKLKHKVVVVFQKHTLGENLVRTISQSGLTEIPEPHTPSFFDFIPGSEELKRIKGKNYIDNFREAISANSDLNGFVTIISKCFFNVARERFGEKDKSRAMNAWIEIFGEDTRFVYLDLKNFAYRIYLKSKKDYEDLPFILKDKFSIDFLSSYKTHFKKDNENWNSNNFKSGQIEKFYVEDLVLGIKEEWERLEDHLGIDLAKKDLDIDLIEFEEQYRISKENLSQLGKV